MLRIYMYLQVAYASKDLKADVILDLATLTGAQGLATGKRQLHISCMYLFIYNSILFSDTL